MNTKRLFLAIDLPTETKKKIENLQKENETLKVKWLEPEKCHLTLLFLGNILISKTSEIMGVVEDICLKNPDFVLKLKGLDVLKRRNRNILCLQVHHPKKLEKLHKDISEGLGEFIDKRKNRFKAHITIAKYKEKNQIRNILDENIENSFGVFKVEKITLFESELDKKPVKYIPIHSFYLK